jgi:hypothetical protein
MGEPRPKIDRDAAAGAPAAAKPGLALVAARSDEEP